MTSRKRGEGAYLRKNVLASDEEGFYPSMDFTQRLFGTAGSREKGYFVIKNYVFMKQAAVTNIYKRTSADALVYQMNMPSNSPLIAVCGTSDVDVVLVLLASGALYSYDGSAATLIHTFSASASAFIVYNGFYWFISINKALFRLDPDMTTITTVKTATTENQSEIVNMQIFNDYVVVTRSLGRFIQFDFWSITEADIDLYQKRVIETNCRHLAVGVIEGTLIFVKSVGNDANKKEKKGDIVVTAFDGEKFVKLNSIRAGGTDVTISGTQPQSVGNGVMVVAVQENESDVTDALFKNWVLKIGAKGEIEVVFEPNDYTNGYVVEAINIEYSTISMLLEKTDGNSVYCDTRDSSSDYDEYEDFTTSQYITNLLNNSKNVHQMVGFGVSFEKVFGQLSADRGERLYIDYRASERDDWTLLHEVNTETIKDYTADEYNMALRTAEYNSDTTGQTIQSYVVTKMPDGSRLPRFNEIQFRFRSKKGFSLLQAWYNYEYIKRNTQ